MSYYEISSHDQSLGVWQGASAQDAVDALDREFGSEDPSAWTDSPALWRASILDRALLFVQERMFDVFVEEE